MENSKSKPHVSLLGPATQYQSLKRENYTTNPPKEKRVNVGFVGTLVVPVYAVLTCALPPENMP
jgi:hypothetical protein